MAKKKTTTTEEPEWIDHTFQLRPDLTMTFQLPRDLTTKDVKRLSRWLATLPDDAEEDEDA